MVGKPMKISRKSSKESFLKCSIAREDTYLELESNKRTLLLIRD